MAKHLAGPIPNPREVKPEIPEAVAAIIRKMMAKTAPERYQTMEDVVAALKGAARA
jgi:serine/threonine-protein kinase